MQYPRWTPILAIAAMAAACDNEPSLGVEGTFPITLTYFEDECMPEDEGRSEAVEITIDRQGDDITIEVGDSGTLTGTIDNISRLMTVEGMIQVPNPTGGSFPGEMRMLARVTEGEVNISGVIIFEGTFPGVSGTCEREFLASGVRASLSPLPLTGS